MDKITKEDMKEVKRIMDKFTEIGLAAHLKDEVRAGLYNHIIRETNAHLEYLWFFSKSV